MELKRIFILLITFLLSFNVFAQQTYICIADASTGFTFNKTTKNWISTNFNVQNQKFILSQKNELWHWKQVGVSESGTIECGEFNTAGFLHCSAFGQDLSFNKSNLRFTLSERVGYVIGERLGVEGSLTPYMTIGKCSPL